ncbi:WW domain-containing protein [Mycena sanguinolenta]|uniref:WW domain-containing protein n=1 Tax=Mycena sanguinolenta TaxID=230812 RepID=A0A8H6YHD7_9AGAR|nr:WW domain-containing protein [Mycena sanguinolenta]
MNARHPKSPRRPAIHEVPGSAYISPKDAHSAHSPPSPDDLPPGWIKQYDPVEKRDFYVDTAIPRSTWSHPYKDEQYLREKAQREKQNIRRHSSASQGIASPVIVTPQRERCVTGEPPKKKLKVISTSPQSAPVPSAHVDITRELELLLLRDFSFPGKYCHAATTASAANPGLNVKGIGILGLPLSDRDAKLVQSLIASSTNVPHPVGNVWELDSRSVECSNPAWQTYLEEIVLKDIWKKLAPHCTRPRLVLQSLLLWEASSDILEYECTETPKRTDEFATIHVILPSFYTGGHVQLSFSGSLENYDLSATSSFSTSLVAWYHGVDCLIKPVESGRRLALSYRLIGGDEGPRPGLPSMTEKLLELRRFLRKWSDIQEYEPDAAPSIIAYPLLHEYRDNDLRADTLKLEDRHKVIHLKGVCDELGFQLGLATLDDHLIGTADSNRDNQGRPRMQRVNTRRLNIKEVFDFDGVPLPGLTKLELNESDVAKTVPSLESAPDLVDPHVIEFHYYRTVVVLFERRRTVEALLHTRRTTYALERLYHVDRRRSSPVDRKIVSYVLASLYRQQPYNFNAQTTLAEIALGWNDVKLWNDIARSTCSHGSLTSGLDSLKWLTAWKAWSFQGIRESIEYCCEKKGVQKSLEFFLDSDPDAFRSVETGQNLDAVLRWSSEQLSKALDTMQHLDRDQVPLFTALIRKKGIQFFWHVVMPSITRVPKAYDFWMEFLRSVYALRPEYTNSEEDASTFNSLSDEGLDTIISDFTLVTRSGDITTRNRRLSEIIDLCIATRRLDMCRRVLFMTVPRDQGADWVPDIVSPLYIPNLRRTLHDHSIEVYHKPFIDFFRAVIGCYLQHVLGSFSGELRRICGSCNVCAALDEFMVAPKLTQAHFVGARTHTGHLQTHLTGATDIVSFYSIADTAVPGGNILIVNKIQDAETDPSWRARKNRAVEFLHSIGEMPIIDRIMGRRYNDALLALDGKSHFIHLEDGSRAGNQSPTRRLAIHHLVQGRWTATSLADGN